MLGSGALCLHSGVARGACWVRAVLRGVRGAARVSLALFCPPACSHCGGCRRWHALHTRRCSGVVGRDVATRLIWLPWPEREQRPTMVSDRKKQLRRPEEVALSNEALRVCRCHCGALAVQGELGHGRACRACRCARRGHVGWRHEAGAAGANAETAAEFTRPHVVADLKGCYQRAPLS